VSIFVLFLKHCIFLGYHIFYLFLKHCIFLGYHIFPWFGVVHEFEVMLQVARSSASSVAFGIGMFAGQGTLGEGKQRAFSVITDTKGNDIHLRFHDTCMAYKVRFLHILQCC
jgi:hypothetical protein